MKDVYSRKQPLTHGQAEDDSLATSTSAQARGEEVVVGTHVSGLRTFFANQLMQHEWLTDVPGDLASQWCGICPKHGVTSLPNMSNVSLNFIESTYCMLGMQAGNAKTGRPALPCYCFPAEYHQPHTIRIHSPFFPVTSSWWI